MPEQGIEHVRPPVVIVLIAWALSAYYHYSKIWKPLNDAWNCWFIVAFEKVYKMNALLWGHASILSNLITNISLVTQRISMKPKIIFGSSYKFHQANFMLVLINAIRPHIKPKIFHQFPRTHFIFKHTNVCYKIWRCFSFMWRSFSMNYMYPGNLGVKIFCFCLNLYIWLLIRFV